MYVWPMSVLDHVIETRAHGDTVKITSLEMQE